MNGRAFLKNILLMIMIIISYFFNLITNTSTALQGIGTRPLLIPFTIAIQFLLLDKRKKFNKFSQFIFLILSILNISWFLYHLYELISYYIHSNYLEIDISYLYITIISITFITSLEDIKKETNASNDILTMITTIIIVLIHYRYYIDKNFLHNIIGNANDINVLQNRYTYITQYYIYFIIMYITLFIQKKINTFKIKMS